MGSIRPNVLASPPTMIASVPSMALGSPPLTGASRNSTPLAAQAAPTFCATTGLMELMSTTVEPFAAPSKMPPGPSTAASTSGPSGSMVMITSACDAASLLLLAAVPPAATTSATGAGATSKTTTECPALSRFFDMGLPMIPSPTNAILAMVNSLPSLRMRSKSHGQTLTLFEGSGHFDYCKPGCARMPRTGLVGAGGFLGDLMRLDDLVDQEQVGEQGAKMDRSVQIVD